MAAIRLFQPQLLQFNQLYNPGELLGIADELLCPVSESREVSFGEIGLASGCPAFPSTCSDSSLWEKMLWELAFLGALAKASLAQVRTSEAYRCVTEAISSF